MIIINKTHSRQDLIDLILTCKLDIVFSFCDLKRDLQDKLLKYIYTNDGNTPIEENIYNITNVYDLMNYLKEHNPHKKPDEQSLFSDQHHPKPTNSVHTPPIGAATAAPLP